MPNDYSQAALGGVLDSFAALIGNLDELAHHHGRVGSNVEIVIRIERMKVLACRGVALVRRHIEDTLH